MQYYLLCLFGDCLMFAKCIRQNFLISILPSDLLIQIGGKTLTDQHIESAFYPHRSANQRISILPLPAVSSQWPLSVYEVLVAWLYVSILAQLGAPAHTTCGIGLFQSDGPTRLLGPGLVESTCRAHMSSE